MFLEQINGPDDLKKINIKNLDELAEEIRNALIIKMSSCGGHLSSNLGVVEATIALHYVFNSPKVNLCLMFHISVIHIKY